MATSKKTTNNKCWQACGAKGTTDGNANLYSYYRKQNWSFLKKSRIGLPYNLAVPPLAFYVKKTKTLIQKDMCTSVFIMALITIAMKVCPFFFFFFWLCLWHVEFPRPGVEIVPQHVPEPLQ